jgi:hypothetical protein
MEDYSGGNSVRTVALVSCVGRKVAHTASARDLYISEWFRRSRRYVEGINCPWFILSAEYGLLTPREKVAPYERTLNAMTAGERRTWALRVQGQMDGALPHAERIIVLAGRRYREYLIEYLKKRGTVEVPLARLGIGQQLQWLGSHARFEKRSSNERYLKL